MASPIQAVRSTSHCIVYTTPELVKTPNLTVYTSVVTLNPTVPAPAVDKDYILSIQAKDLNKPRCIAEVDHQRNSVAVSLTLVPQFGVPCLDSQEYIFVVDRSGSMSEDGRIEYAKDALQLLLLNLPVEGTVFNIASFGSSFSFLWSRSQEYSPSSTKIAVSIPRHLPSLAD